MSLYRRALALSFFALPVLSFAHHGTRFIIATEYDMVRQPFFFFNGEYAQFRHADSTTLVEPALLMPLGHGGWYEFEIHAHIEGEGSETPKHHATGFEIRHRFTRRAGWNYAAGLEYETTQQNVEEGNNWTATLIAGKEDQHGMVLLNLVDNLEAEPGAKQNWGYRAAWSPTPDGLVNWSFEVQGDLVSHGSHEVAIGYMRHLDLDTMIKLGVGTGLTSDSPRFTFRLGIVRALGGIE